MTCDTALELISAKLDGELTAEEAAQLEQHLARCESCRALQTELSAIHSACCDLEVAPPPSLRDNILKNLPPQEKPASKPKIVSIHWKRWTAMVASFALVALAAWQLPRSFSTGRQPSAPAQQSADTSTNEAAFMEDNSPVPTSIGPESGSPDVSMVSPAAILPDLSDSSDSPDLGAGSAADANIATASDSEEAQTVTSKDYAPRATPSVKSATPQSAGGATSQNSPENAAPSATAAPCKATYAEAAQPSAVAADDADGLESFDNTDAESIQEPWLPAEANEADGMVFARSAQLPTPSYCGVLNLNGGFTLNGYPSQQTEDGEIRYELPDDAFYALINELNAAKIEFDLRTFGEEVSSSAQIGLVIISP